MLGKRPWQRNCGALGKMPTTPVAEVAGILSMLIGQPFNLGAGQSDS